MFTREEELWIERNIREDFEIGFSEKLRFIDGRLTNLPPEVDLSEAESDGYFCAVCGRIQIDFKDLEEHVRKCMKGSEADGNTSI